MTSISPSCELEEGEISDDAEELNDYDARTALVPRPPAKPFGIESSSSSSRTPPQPHPHKCRRRVNNSSSVPRYYKKPLSVFNPPSGGGHYDRNSGGHSRPPLGGTSLRSAVLCRPPAPSRGSVSLPSFVASHDPGRTMGAGGDDRCGGRRSTSHLDHYSWFRRPSLGHSNWDLENSSTSSSSNHGRFQPPSSQRSRPDRSPSPPSSHSGSARKNQSQPKFLQNSVSNEPSYEDLLAQYKSIQHQLDDLNKHSIEEHHSTNTTTHEKSSKSNERRKKAHKPKCRRSRKSLSEDKPKEVLGEEGKEQVPPLSAIPVICAGTIECRSLPVSPTPPTPLVPLPQASDISDDDDDADLVELRRKALESLKSTKPPEVQEEQKTEATDPPDEADSSSVLPLEVLPSDLLETERPIKEVQEKQQLKKGHRHPWYDRELTQQMRRKDRAYHKWKRHPCYDNWEAFKAIKRVYLRMLKRKRAAYAQANGGEEDSTTKGAAESAAAAAEASSLPVDSDVMAPMLPLDSIPLPNGQLSVDNYEPVEMEVDSDDGTQACTLEVAAGSDDEDVEALRAQLLQAVLQKRRRKTRTSECSPQQQQVQQVQPQLPQQLPQQQQQQRTNHRTPLSPLNGASAVAVVQPVVEPKEISRTASPNGLPPKTVTPPATCVTPRGRQGPDAAFVETKMTEPVVINLAVDDTTSEEEEEDEESEVEEEPLLAVENSFSLGLDKLLKEARQKAQVPPPPSVPVAPLAATPVSVMKLSQAQQLEYRRLKAEIARRELHSVMTGGKLDAATQQQLNRARRLKQQASAKRSLEALENTLHTERKALRLEGKRMDALKSEVLTKKSAVRGTHVRIQRLREQLATLERLMSGHAAGIRKANLQLQALQMAIDKRKGHIKKLESQCNLHGKIVYGDKYQLPETPENVSGATTTGKRKISISSLQQSPKRARITGPDSGSKPTAPAPTKRNSAAILAEKIRLQKLEVEMRLRLQELKQSSLAKSSLTVPVTATPVATTTAPSATSEAPSKTVAALAASSPRPESPLSSPSRAAASRTVVVSKTAGKVATAALTGSAGQGEAAARAEATVPVVPTVTVTITVGNDSEASSEPPFCKHRTAMEALFLEHCEKQLRTSHPCVGLSSSAFSLPQTDALKKLELCLLRPPKDTAMTSVSTLYPVNIAAPYTSPLLCFRGYRLNPNYLKQPGCTLDSTSYAHKMHSRTHLCRYELNGACYDERCGGQHKKDYMCTADEVLIDLALYSPTLLNILPTDSPQQCKQKAENYVANMKQKHKGLDTQALCQLIVTDVNRSLNKVAPHYTAFQRRGWVFQQSQEPSHALKSLDAADKPAQLVTEKDWKCLLQQQIAEVDDPELVDLEQDFRYFDSSHLGTAALEQLVIDQPHNIELWLRLAYRHLYGKHHSDEGDPEIRLDQALNVFSQALENNRASPEVWRHYLGWYAAHPQCSDLDYLCHKALDYCSHNSVWWKCVTLVDALPSKCQLCQQQLYNLTQGVSDGKQPDSQCVLEVLLYWAQLCAVAGNMPLAYLILKTSVKSVVKFEHFVDPSDSGELLDVTTRDILQCANMLLSPSDVCFLWLCYLHFVEFRSLPAGLFCIERGSVGRLCSTHPFEIPWDQHEGLTQSPDSLLHAFHEAEDELGGPDKCVALFASHLNLLVSQSMGSSAVQLCNAAVEDNPGWSDGWLQLVELYVKAGDMEEATNALQRGLSRLPTDPRLLFKAASGNFDMPSAVIHELLDNFVSHYFQINDSLVGRQKNAEESCISFPKLVDECDGHAVYMRLNFIELLKMSGGSPRDVCELYETLLTVSETTSDVQIAWWWYLNYQLEAVVRREAGAADVVSGLVQRCLGSVPTRRSLPTEPRKLWSDYNFTNHMLNLLAAHMTSPRDAADLLWSYLQDRIKPNPSLVQRVVELYLQSNDRDRAETVLRAALVPGLQSLRLWQLGIQLAATEGDSYEVHRLFEAAVLSMPYHADLWCHFLIYELTQGHVEHAQKVVESASKYQVPGAREILDNFLSKELTEEEALKRLGVFLLPP